MGRDFPQSHRPSARQNLVSWQSAAHSPPCWGGMSRSWGEELLPLLETLQGSWVRETSVLSSQTQRVDQKSSELLWKVPPCGLPSSYTTEGLPAMEKKLGSGWANTHQAQQVRGSVF